MSVTMNLNDLRWLRSDEGMRLVALAQSLHLGDAARLRSVSALRRETDAHSAALAFEMALLRERAATKFPHAATMYFTRDALEQSTSATLAAHRARRFAAFDRVADLGCGIGGDALSIAAITRVVGVDRDPLRVAMARANADVCGHGGSSDWLVADIIDGGPARADAGFVDPSRRDADGRRIFSPAQYAPPLPHILLWRDRFAMLAVKVSPGIQDDQIASFDGEVEFVSHHGDLKEAVLWSGIGMVTGRRATLLPAGDMLFGSGDLSMTVASIGQVIYEPDPAVIRAHLIGTLARTLGAWQIDESIAYLSADTVTATPFARAWHVEAVLPFGVDRIRRYLRAREVGQVTVKKRGSPLEPETFVAMLRLRGGSRRTLLLTRQAGTPVCIICHDGIDSPSKTKGTAADVERAPSPDQPPPKASRDTTRAKRSAARAATDGHDR